MRILLFNQIHQTPHGPRHKQFACVAQLVQQSPCKRSFVGSTPITGLNSSGAKSWSTLDQLLRDSSAVERTVVNRDVAGSIPARAELWMSSSSLGPEVVGLVTRARIPSSTPSACLRQPAERDGLNPLQSEFKSQDKHHASVVQSAETTVLEAVRCKFESCQGHQCVDRLTGKPTASKAVTLCSNHSQRANGVKPTGRKRFTKPSRHYCLLGSNPSYSENGDDPNWKGACFENRYAERLAGSSPCHLRQYCQDSNGGPCGRLKSGLSQFNSESWHHARVGERLKPRSCNLRPSRAR